jgi:hypothetical protein
MKKMRDMFRYLLPAAVVVFGYGAYLHAQQSTGVTQSPTKLDAATFLYGQSNGATSCNTVSQTAAQDTVTIPAAPGGQYIYITGVYIQISTDATGVTETGTISTTNITGAPFWSFNTALSTTSQGVVLSDTFPTGLKAAQPGTAVTFVPSATQNSHKYLCMRVAGFYAQ